MPGCVCPVEVDRFVPYWHSDESRLSSFAWVGWPTSANLPNAFQLVECMRRSETRRSAQIIKMLLFSSFVMPWQSAWQIPTKAGIYNKKQGRFSKRPCLGSALFGLSYDCFADHEPGYDHLLDLWRAIAQQVAHDIPQPHRNGMFGAIAWMPDYYHHILYALH